MSSNDIIKCFPFPEFRDRQKEVISRVGEALDNDRNVLISAATGFGKSPVNICACDYCKDAFYTTPLILLQNQLDADFSDRIAVIKGRKHYQCGIDNEATAADAVCTTKSGYKCEARKFSLSSNDTSCPYNDAKAAARMSHTICSNTSYMMVVSHDEEYGGFNDREVLVVDEAHGLDEWAIMFVSVTLDERDVGKIPVFKRFSDYVDWVNLVSVTLLNKYDVLQKQLDSTKENSKNRIVVGLREERDRMISAFQKCGVLTRDYEDNGEEWAWEMVETGRGMSIAFKPITSGRFLENMLWSRAKRIILSSATILYPKLYLMDIGLDISNTEIIDVKSTFPVSNRPFYIDSCGKVNRITNDYLMEVMANRVSEIMDAHPHENGIVHCHSYNNANIIYDTLSDVRSDVVLQDRERRNESLQEWIDDDDPTLFLSVNFKEGVDLKDDLCRYQVGVKVPYPYMGDKRVQARMKLNVYKCKCGTEFRSLYPICKKCGAEDAKLVYADGEIWYAMKTIESIIQSYGRAVRTPTDYADYYELDGSFAFLYYQNKNTLFPSDFKKAMTWL